MKKLDIELGNADQTRIRSKGNLPSISCRTNYEEVPETIPFNCIIFLQESLLTSVNLDKMGFTENQNIVKNFLQLYFDDNQTIFDLFCNSHSLLLSTLHFTV